MHCQPWSLGGIEDALSMGYDPFLNSRPDSEALGVCSGILRLLILLPPASSNVPS
jgi:hypothetical protein